MRFPKNMNRFYSYSAWANSVILNSPPQGKSMSILKSDLPVSLIVSLSASSLAQIYIQTIKHFSSSGAL